MSRHVANTLARRPLHLSPAQSTIAPRNRFFLWSALNITATHTPARLSPRSFSSYQDAAAKDTGRISWSGPSASITSRVGLRRTAFLLKPRHIVPYRPHAGVYLPQRRLFSDEKTSEHLRPKQSTHQSGAIEEASKAAQENAAQKTILDRLPHLHRPTKDELLAAATGFWQRLGIRFKWFSIRSVRPFTLDEIGAFVSWVFLGHILWIVIGTTTFVSLGIWALNTVFAQETLAGWVGNYLTKSSGIKVVFESAIVPTWKSGVITFNNVFVSRRPGQQSKRERAVSKGSSTTAAAAAEAAMAEKSKDTSGPPEDDGNYSQFDVTIKTVNVTLSFRKWFNGKGLLHEVEVQGVRGVIDRTSVRPTQGYVDPKSYRHEHNPGDFEIDEFKMSDVLLTVHQPNNFRPFNVSVFNCDLPRLRKQWLFYDFMSANHMSGSFDDSLFTIHPRQVHGISSTNSSDDSEGEGQQWKKHSRLRIDGLKIDHLNRGVDGPFSWIHHGNVDIVADVMIPNDDAGVWRQSWQAMSELYDRVEASVTSSNTAAGAANNSNGKTVLENASDTALELLHGEHASAARRFLVLDITCHLNSVRASVPIFTKDLSYVNNALVRPIVAYINSRPQGTFIPVHCRVVKRQSEFDGSWTVFDSGLLDDLSREVYAAFARDIEDGGRRKRRIKKVGWWTLQLAAQALFIGLAGQLA